METRHMVQYDKVINVWPAIAPILSPPTNDDELDKLIEFSDYLMDQIQGDDKHPLIGLLDIVGSLIAE